ncbi:MAG: hypothetical protein CMJ34_13370 [Phycisphaerae bacterium]|nr:hypothetical protein [Phycisphaerae bacterium]
MNRDAALKNDPNRPGSSPASRLGADDRAEGLGIAGRGVQADGRSWAPHRAFTNEAHAHFGNRLVGAALRGEETEGPAAVIHTVVALGAAGVHVGDDFFGVVSNTRMGEVVGDLASQGAESEVAAPSVTLAARLQRRRSGGDGAQPAAQPVQAALQAGGRPLPSQVRADLERRFGGVSFAGVRIHTDGRAARATEAVQAEAFTVGQQIWFSRGAFSPETRTGMHLLTHELTHVLQNRQSEMISGGTEVNGVAVSAPSDSREREAEAVAHEVSRVEAAPEVDGPGDALSQLASRWSVELSTMAGAVTGSSGGGGAESVLASGGPSADAAAITAQRAPGGDGGKETGGEKEKDKAEVSYKTLADGSKVKIEEDGTGGWFLRGPDGEKVPCNKEGTPTPGTEEQLANDAKQKGEGEAEVCEEEQTEEETCEEEEVEEECEEEVEGEKEEGAGDLTGAGGGDVSAATSSGGAPLDFGKLSEGPLAPYMHEKSWHEGWAAAGSQEGGLNTMDTGDKGSLVLSSLGSGLAEGFVNGAQALLVDTLLNKATKRIPYAGGFIAAIDIIKSPSDWWKNSFADPASQIGELWGGDWLDRLEAILNVFDMANTVISTISTLLLVVAGAGFIISLFFPPLMPFVAMAAKWGLLLGEVSTMAGLILDVARAALIAARSAQIMMSDADPEVQAKRAERLQAQTSKWMTGATGRAGNNLVRKKGSKADGGDSQKSGSAKAGSGGPDATNTKKSWRSKADTVGKFLTGGSSISGQLTETRKAHGEAKGMNKARKETKGKPVAERLDAMQQAGGESPIMSEGAMKRARNYDAAEAKKSQGGGSSSKNPTSQTKTGGSSSSLEPADIRKEAMSPDFWDPKKAGTRKAIRKDVLAKAARETDPKKKAALQKIADDMAINEQLLNEHLTGKSQGPDTGAVARVTGEKKLAEHGTAGPRGIQNVAMAKDVAGTTSANAMGDKLGFERSYQKSTQQSVDNFVAVIYRPDGTPVRADGQGMSQLVDSHGAQAIGYNNKKWGTDTNPNLFGSGDDVRRNVETATNTPLAPKKGSTPQLHGKQQTRERKKQLETLLGANSQKTTDGNTLTEDGHKKRQAPVTTFEEKRQTTLNNARNKTDRSQRARNLGPEAEAVGKKFAETKGDSVPEYYDDVTNHSSSAMSDGATPLNFGTAKTLDQYEHMPLVMRLDWDGQGKSSGSGGSSSSTHMGTSSSAFQEALRQRMVRNVQDYEEASEESALTGIKDGVVDAVQGTGRDFFTSDNLDGNDVVNGYGHQGSGGVFGAGTAPVVDMINSAFSSGAVDEQGNAVLDKDGQQKRVSYKDQMLAMTGIAGQDAAGNSMHDNSLKEMQARETEEVNARLAQFELDYISASGDLEAPPVAQEKVAQDASVDWGLYDQEIQSLQACAAEIGPLKGEADQSQQLLEAEKASVQAMKPQVEEHKAELEDKKKKQDTAAEGQDKLQSEGTALTEGANKVLAPLSTFVGPFKQMAGMVPSKLSSSGSGAAGGADQLQSTFTESTATGDATSSAAAEGKTLVGGMKASTEGASNVTATAEANMGSVETIVDKDIVETAQGQAELEQAEADAQARIATLEGKKASAENTHSGAVESMNTWASEHHGARTGHRVKGDQQMTDIETEVKKLENKRKQGPGDFPASGPTGTAYASLAGPMPTDAVSNIDSGLLSGGFALPGSVSAKMESAFGQDFSSVRIHTGSLANEAASGFNAEAFNFGSHIIFGSGMYRPGTSDGDSLLAHELTHVAQQPSHTVGRGSAGVRLERPGASLEKEASRVASVMKSASGSSLEGIAKQAMRGGKPKA